jgi:hypothetical protein
LATRWTPRHTLAATRLRNILRRHTVANDRILEQKISDAGPINQRVDPHILTQVRHELTRRGEILPIPQTQTPWYHLSNADPQTLGARYTVLDALHRQTANGNFTVRLGQTLEIAVFRALRSQTALQYFGAFADLDDHDDNSLYSKIEPPSFLSGRHIPDNAKLDFLVHNSSGTYAGIEVKNKRQWMYPNRPEIRELLFKCCCLDVVPVLIARRIHYSTFTVLNPCGVIFHQTFNQLYPASEQPLADQVKDKNLLGYHDIRVGNNPDARLAKFLTAHLPSLLPRARQQYDDFKDLLCGYANGEHDYKSFAARVRRRSQNLPEDSDVPDIEPDPSDYDF